MSENLNVLSHLQIHPSPQAAYKPLVTLSDLEPGAYVNTVVRVAFIKSREKEDELGKRPCVFGVAEDSTFKTPFVCYKPYQMFFKDSVFKFQNAYVHQLTDHSILLVLTEHSKIKYLPEETGDRYIWHPEIGSIHRPLGRCRVTLEGVISKVYRSSGLVRRCDGCGRVIFEGSCPHCQGSEWYWSLRINSRLSDETGSINTIFSQYLTCKLLGRSISDILCTAKVPSRLQDGTFNTESFKVKPPKELAIHEYTVIDPILFKQCRKLVVPDKKRSKIYSPRNVKLVSKHTLDVRERVLNYSDEEDKVLYRNLLEKALDLEIRNLTNLSKLHGIYQTEEPKPLYYAERAKLYLGFELEVHPQPEFIKVEFYPTGLIRESVLDYVQWRRSRGGSPKSIRNTLLNRKRNVILAPNGTIGAVSKVLFEDAGSFYIPDFNVSLPQFWKTSYDITIEPREKPLLVVKPYNLDVELTYPPSCVFFDEQTLTLKSSVLRYVEYKKFNVKNTVFKMADDLIRNLKIGRWQIETIGDGDLHADVRRQILQEIKEKLLGKRVKATGSIVQPGSRVYFFPKIVAGVYQT